MRVLACIGCCAIVISSYAQTAEQPKQDQAESQKPSDSHVFVLGDLDEKGKPLDKSAGPLPVTNVALPEQKLDHKAKLELIRALNAEIAYARRPLPRLQNGLTLPANGHVEPSEDLLNQYLLQYGIAAKKGERVQITDMEIGDRSIRFILNGGAKTKHKWYEHVSVGMGGGEVAPMAKADNPNAKGTMLTLTFPKYVPDVSAAQVRELLSPVLDFTVKSPMQAYADTLPPHIKAAVLEHKALVGMNHEMVMAALGRPDKKFRDDNDAGGDVEDWMYGKPPATVKFLRFKGDELVRIKEMPVGESAIVRDKPEIDPAELATFQQERRDAIEERKSARAEANRPAPTMRREGDPDPVVPTTSDTVSVRQRPGQGTTPNGTTPPTIDPSTAPGTPSQDPNGYPSQTPGRTPVGTQGPTTAPNPMPFPGSPTDTGTGPR